MKLDARLRGRDENSGGSQRAPYPLWLCLTETQSDADSELMCHPGHADMELRVVSSYAVECERETAALTDATVLDAVGPCAIELITFAQL